LKQSKKFLVFGLLAASVLGMLSFSEEVRAIVEPHITINMEPSQTTKPFVINDDTGTEVFSVDVDGTITPAGTTTGSNGLTSFEFFQKSPVTFFGDRDNPFVFAKWRLTWNLSGGTPKITLIKNLDIVSGEIRGLGIDGSGAAATGDLGVSQITVTDPGSGYPPDTRFPVTITGDGSGAIGEAIVSSDGTVRSISVIEEGSGYTSPPTVTIDPPPSGTTATATAMMGVFGLNIISGGSGYNSPQVVTFTGGGGSGAIGQTEISGPGGSVIGYDRSNRGSGYTSPPTAVFVDEAKGVARAEIRVIEGTRVDTFSTISEGTETFANRFNDRHIATIGLTKTEQTIDIAFVGYGESRVGELRNTYWQFQMRVPDFVTVERIQ